MNRSEKRPSVLPPELETEMQREGMYIQPRMQIPRETRDNSSEGKHKAFTPTAKPTEIKNNMNTTMPTQQSSGNTPASFQFLNAEETVKKAAELAATAAKEVHDMIGWQHRLVNAAGAGLIGGAVVLGGLGIYKWITGPTAAAKPMKG